jgi:hypothetical protein
MILDFGRYRGRSVEDIPLTYMIFLAGYKMMGSKRMKSDLEASKWVEKNKSELRTHALTYLEGRCWHCGQKLVSIGPSRENSALDEDWNSRYLHKKCWRELTKEMEEGVCVVSQSEQSKCTGGGDEERERRQITWTDEDSNSSVETTASGSN